MAIAKKGTRSIIVDGQQYRWKVTRSYRECLGWWNGAKYSIQVTLSAERFDEPASKLVATIQGFLELGFQDNQYFAPADLAQVVPDPNDLANVSRLVRLAVSPSQVAEVIRFARLLGWNPDRDGRSFVIQDINAALAGAVFPALGEQAPTNEEYEQFKEEFWSEYRQAFQERTADEDSHQAQVETDQADEMRARRLPRLIKIWSAHEDRGTDG